MFALRDDSNVFSLALQFRCIEMIWYGLMDVVEFESKSYIAKINIQIKNITEHYITNILYSIKLYGFKK